VCPVGALEHVADEDVDGVGHPHRAKYGAMPAALGLSS
jgi:hypothetical protein